jgi:hypothetical protein
MAPRWPSYAAGSEVGRFAKSCREHVIHSEDGWEGKPLVLEAWQQRMMGAALAFDSDGGPTWPSVVLGKPGDRGSPKFQPAARRWLVRYLTEGTPSLRDVAKVTSSLDSHAAHKDERPA